MNGQKLACVLIIMVIACLAYGGQTIQKRNSASQKEAEEADGTRVTADSLLKAQEITHTLVEAKTRNLRQFLKDWEPIISRFQSPQDAEQAINSVLRSTGIFILTQKFDVKTIPNNGMMSKVLQGTIIVQDEYSKTLNWLGDLERRLPLARMTACRIKQGENGRQINLELNVELPLIEAPKPPAPIEAPEAKKSKKSK